MALKGIITATTKNIRISPKKVAPVMNLVRGMDLVRAKVQLAFDTTKAARLILKTLKSAEANAVNNKNLNINNLYVSDLQVSGGTLIKRGRPGSRGHYSPILKRTSHFYVGLDERVSSKKELK